MQVTGAQVETGGTIGQVKLDYADWLGQRYGYGEKVWELASRYPVETFQGSDMRYGADLHLFLIFLGLALTKAPQNVPLSLVVPAPPGIVNRVAKTMRDNILAGEDGLGNGTWNITLNGAKKPQTFVVERVITVPEGVPGYAAYRFDVQGELTDLSSPDGYDYLTGHVHIVDLGFGTADAFDIIDGKVAADSIEYATHPELGISTLILQPLLDQIKSQTNAQWLTLSHVDGWLRDWVKANYNPDSANIRIGQHRLDLHLALRAYADWYTDQITETLIKPAVRVGVDTILEVGGGWLLAEQRIKARFPRQDIVSPDMFSHTRIIPLYELDAYGALTLVANNLLVHRGGKRP